MVIIFNVSIIHQWKYYDLQQVVILHETVIYEYFDLVNKNKGNVQIHPT